jgi:hypothetical protein
MPLPLVRSVRLISAASALFLTWGAFSPVFAQEAFVPSPPSPTETIEALDRTDTMAGRTPFFTVGPVGLRPYASYRYDYGDGLRAGAGSEVKSARHRFAPGVEMFVGPKWTLDYSPTWNAYSSDEFKDGVDHYLSARGNILYEDWAILPSYRYSRSSPILVETADQTEQKTHDINLTVGRRLSSSLGVELTANQNMRYADATPDVRDRSLTPRVRYQFADPLGVYGGVTFGRTTVQDSPDMKYYQPTAGVTWRVTGKTTADVYAGWERRKFLDGVNLTQSTPVYGAAVTLRPFEFTTVSLSASRQVTPSFFYGQTRESTRWGLDLNQRLLGRLWFGAGIARDDADYASSLAALAVVRRDERDTYYVRLGMDFLRGGTVSVSYAESDNDSNLPGFTYSSSQISVEVSYRF